MFERRRHMIGCFLLQTKLLRCMPSFLKPAEQLPAGAPTLVTSQHRKLNSLTIVQCDIPMKQAAYAEEVHRGPVLVFKDVAGSS